MKRTFCLMESGTEPAEGTKRGDNGQCGGEALECSSVCGPPLGEAPGRSGYRSSALSQGICVYSTLRVSGCHGHLFDSLSEPRAGPAGQGGAVMGGGMYLSN